MQLGLDIKHGAVMFYVTIAYILGN